MAETATTNRTSEQWEQRRAANSVLLLQEMLKADDAQLQKDFYQQACDQELSHIPEVLEGDTRTHFEFAAHDGRLFVLSPDGLIDWLGMHRNGVDRARKKVSMPFYAQIAEAELEEAKAQLEQVSGGEPSTILAISLDGSDLASVEDLKSLGRDPEKKRAYLRASAFDGETLHLYSETYDGLTIEGAKQILERFGVHLPSGANSIDILKSRVKLEGAHHDLLMSLTPRDKDNVYDFVLGQKDLLDLHMKNLIGLARSNLVEADLACQVDEFRYNIMSSFKQRLEGSWQDFGSLGQSVSYAGTIERSIGTHFAGCDAVLGGPQNNLNQTGYINAYNFEISSLLKNEFESKWCPNCLPEPKPGKKVKAWRQGDKIGCSNCGHEVDICTKIVVKQGKNQKPAKSWLW